MVIVREYQTKDFEEVVNMYYKMVHDVYPNRQFKSKQFFYKNVINWIDNNYDIMITEDNGIITGFAMCYEDNMGGICKPFYTAECVYIKPEYRKGRSAYLMYQSAMIFADNMDYIISTNASEVTESHNLASKFGTKIFTQYERVPNKIKENE